MFCFGNLLFPNAPWIYFCKFFGKFKKNIGLWRNTLNVIFCMSKEYWIFFVDTGFIDSVYFCTIHCFYSLVCTLLTWHLTVYLMFLMFQLYKIGIFFNVLCTSISFVWLWLPNNRHYILGKWVGIWLVGACFRFWVQVTTLLPTNSLAYSILMI